MLFCDHRIEGRPKNANSEKFPEVATDTSPSIESLVLSSSLNRKHSNEKPLKSSPAPKS